MNIIRNELPNKASSRTQIHLSVLLPIDKFHTDDVVDVVQHLRCLRTQRILCLYHLDLCLEDD